MTRSGILPKAMPAKQRILHERDIESFIERGFLRLDNAFPRETAEAARAILWEATGFAPHNPTTWTQPVVRIGERSDPPFLAAANAPRLRAALDELVGQGRWLPRGGLGTFVVRFPSEREPGDDGWHVDASFPGADAYDYFSWRINVHSRGRALLMLFLFSDVEERDAPTRLRVGSHAQVARLLAPAGEAGLSFMELAQRLDVTRDCPVELGVGAAGTVYLCHPFLVHAGQAHRGHNPRFLAQPPLLPVEPPQLGQLDATCSPVEEAIRRALA